MTEVKKTGSLMPFWMVLRNNTMAAVNKSDLDSNNSQNEYAKKTLTEKDKNKRKDWAKKNCTFRIPKSTN